MLYNLTNISTKSFIYKNTNTFFIKKKKHNKTLKTLYFYCKDVRFKYREKGGGINEVTFFI